MLFLLVFLSTFANAFSSKPHPSGKLAGKQINLLIEGQSVVMRGAENRIVVHREGDESYALMIDLKERLDDRTVYFINREKNYYIAMSWKEINNITKFKKMLLPQMAKNEEIKFISLQGVSNRGGFQSSTFKASFEESEAVAEFSKEAKEDLSLKVNYEGIVSFLSEIELDAIGIPDISFDIIKAFLSQSKDLGMLVYLKVWDREIYSLQSVEDCEFDEEIFSIEPSLEKRGLDGLIGELF